MIKWRDIPGFDGRYQINELGQVRAMTRGKMALRSPIVLEQQRCNNGYIVVNLIGSDGKAHKHTVARLMAITYLGCDDTMVAYNKNGAKTDNAIENIAIRSRAGKRTARFRRRPVCKLSLDGEILEVYSSVNEAARANYLTPPSITKRCRNQIKNTGEDFFFRYDNEVDYG